MSANRGVHRVCMMRKMSILVGQGSRFPMENFSFGGWLMQGPIERWFFRTDRGCNLYYSQYMLAKPAE